MNDEKHISDEELALATSRRLPVDRTLSDDAAVARESFLALGSRLEASSQMLDEQALVQRIVGRLNNLDAAGSAKPGIAVSLHSPLAQRRARQDRNAGWPRFITLVVSGALAAAACYLVLRIPSSPVTQNQKQPQIAIAIAPKASTAASAIPEAALMPVEEPSALAWNDSLPWNDALGRNDSLSWNDPLDDEIAMAAAAMGRMSASTRDVDASLYDMNEVLSALSAELAGESL